MNPTQKFSLVTLFAVDNIINSFNVKSMIKWVNNYNIQFFSVNSLCREIGIAHCRKCLINCPSC